MRINLTDNNTGQVKAGTFLRKDVSALFPIADKTIAQLCHENENLLIFPYSIEESDDKVGEASVMTILNTSDPEKVRITTGNVMGFIGVGDLQIKLNPDLTMGATTISYITCFKRSFRSISLTFITTTKKRMCLTLSCLCFPTC